ncbi:exonuclease V, gamma chain with recB and recD: 5' and 3' nuclease, ATPase, recombinase, helicase [Xenorhabdus bovienii str. puntauvense]|uniref:RecBCD enzyme subunit RecC n=1 Tax=Xenorhabdus bovienii str. puntauvense TaxID=1398201 RepID=A0A077NJU5_XENBV|nr:exodeoxyribonuclease V subunit gamma [Xenorhabdus bovienii]CDG99094.1 exonuclease V, gamma chain with recB and recD: 5' and 3' nuclease, ATPase, recombinase, helicase [Xenorhabdus bovienii str. puntauvense]
MFRVYHSNQLDILKELMAIFIGENPLTDPFGKEVVLVQSPGMSQWLQIQLAEKLGIAANMEFPLPATFIWQMFTQVLPDVPKDGSFSKDAMKWKLMTLLPGLLTEPEFSSLRHYLDQDIDKRKIHQLAGRVADLFDQYLVYRPQWLESWESDQSIDGLSDNQAWQKRLWLELTEYTRQLEQPLWHRANLYHRFISTLQEGRFPLEKLPARVFICGVSTLPPAYLQIFKALGQHIDIHLMFTNPCLYYWGDIQSYAFLAKLNSRKPKHYQSQQSLERFRDPENASSLFNDEGEQSLNNPLLASWGKLGRDNLYLLSQLEPDSDVHAFVELESGCILHQIQRDMLNLEDHAQIGSTEHSFKNSLKKRQIDGEDRSLSFHSCHSPQREVEVLQDQILRLLDGDPSLTPRDIIVMMADIDSYAPYIQAVFGNAPEERYIPFAISDRKARQAHPVLQAFITLLELPQSRFTAEQVLALLEVPALASKFAIQEDGLRLLRRWVKESGICWGLDDDNIEALSLPATGQNTWRFGLTRMLLGYAMDSHAGPWNDVLPYDESSGLAAELAGQLAEFLMELNRWRKILSEEQRLSDWLAVCPQLLETFFDADEETELVLALITQQWQKVIDNGLNAHYSESVPLVLLRDELALRFDDEKISQRFLAGSLNFCTLMPMRSIPFKVVCLLGMNDGVYPRTIPPLGFDLMAEKSQRGDRKRRDDDRYLFLEALISAETCLYISYIGKSIRDDTECNPSVLVNELLDYVCQSCCLPGDEMLNVDDSARNVRNHLLLQHTRVPFAMENFVPDHYQQSYAAEWLPAASQQGVSPVDFCQPIGFESSEIKEVTLDELIRFYRYPVRAFFQRRLKVHFVIEETELPEEEPFVLDHLQRYQFNQLLLNILIEEGSPESLFYHLRASGGLPHGAFGEVYWLNQLEAMQPLANKIREERMESSFIDLHHELDTVVLTGKIHQVQPDGILRWRPANLMANDGIQLWIEHLAYCFSGNNGDSESRMYGRENSEWRFSPLTSDEAKKYLNQMVAGYFQGMSEPLPLFCRSGWAWLDDCFDRESQEINFSEEAQQKAENKLMQQWLGTQGKSGESSDAYVQRAFRQVDQLFWVRMKREVQSYLLPMACHLSRSSSK